ncbi:S41 family peptidase [Fusibacter ferrireducens]|uniref:S41 family peptidase n=1 Tax=Fusibacter ferrireducens TaxID=2785058 RepID=A0ABR9ZY29_9FIRM|nr:S41 family peptidase [Fusibacter ferrireducens]MBF4695363.1 S41 family peptidase [Fusibacter ferrireducens]
MKKINVVILSVLLIFASSGITFFVTTMTQVDLGDKVVISKDDFETYQTTINKYKEVEILKDYIEKNYYKDVTDELMLEGMKKGIFSVLEDPYSVFMNKEEYKSYMESSSGEYPGIGVYLVANDDNEIEIVAPIEDTPGERAGLLAKDLIIGVNGEAVDASVMDETIAKVKGEPGTSVTLTIYRPSIKDKFDVDIERAWIDVKVVKSRMLDENLGYLRLSMFDENSAAEFDRHMKELVSQGAKGVVIDLRQDPGGYLDQCVKIADSLLGKSLIVYTESRNGDNERFESDAKKFDVELVVLVDQGSASASEILTGALKDNNAATIVGVTTFGKGIVQIVRPLKDGTGLKLTTSEYFTPSGKNIHKIGIEPDVVVPLDENYNKIENPTDEDDNQLQKAIEILKEKVK